MATWREEARALIDEAKDAGTAKGFRGRDLLHHLRGAFPLDWTPTSWEYRVWLHEVRRSLGRSPRPYEKRKRLEPAKGQMNLF